jgi:hypothetical protein
MISLLLPTDGCPQCISGTPVHPRDVNVRDEFCLRAWYACPACGHRWDTYWALEARDLPCPGCPGCSDERKTA